MSVIPLSKDEIEVERRWTEAQRANDTAPTPTDYATAPVQRGCADAVAGVILLSILSAALGFICVSFGAWLYLMG